MKPPAKHSHSAKPARDDAQRFTNADADLRPIGSPVLIAPPTKNPDEQTSHNYLVTAETFPRLHKDFSEMQEKLGGAPYRLVITDALPHDIIADSGDQLIRIRLSAVASVPYKDILQHLGHEHGHIWRELHPKALEFPFSQTISKPITEELEADLMGVCLTRDKPAALAWNARGGHGISTEYANKATFAREVIALKWKDCPADAAPLEPVNNPSPITIKNSPSRTP